LISIISVVGSARPPDMICYSYVEDAQVHDFRGLIEFFK